MTGLLDPATQTVALGTACLGATAGLVGTFAVVRRQSLQGDAMAHAALSGLAGAFLLGGRSFLVLLFGGAVAAWLAVVIVAALVRGRRGPFDAVLGGVLAVAFGLGLVGLKVAEPNPDSATHGMGRLLFGQAALMQTADVTLIAVVGGVLAGGIVLFWNDLRLFAFDPEFAAANGVPVRWIDVGLTAATATAVVLGLQVVGAVLMSTLLVAPAVAARQWTNRLGWLAALSAGFGATAGIAGTLASDVFGEAKLGVPTGPLIVLSATAVTLLSLLAGPIRRRFRGGAEA